MSVSIEVINNTTDNNVFYYITNLSRNAFNQKGIYDNLQLSGIQEFGPFGSLYSGGKLVWPLTGETSNNEVIIGDTILIMAVWPYAGIIMYNQFLTKQPGKYSFSLFEGGFDTDLEGSLQWVCNIL